MMLAPGAITAAVQTLGDGRAFYRDTHRRIYRTAAAMHATGDPVDSITLAAQLEQEGTLEQVGGRERIHELAALVPATTTTGFYAGVVARLHRQRSLLDALEHATRQAENGGVTPETLADLRMALEPAVESIEPLAVTLDQFLGQKLEATPALLGTPEDTLIPAGGLVVLAGMPGGGKTTLIIDLVFHLASGLDWLGFHVEKPLRILLIENEGPQHKFQAKLAAKAKTWEHPIEGEIHVQTHRWGSFTFKDPAGQQLLRQYLDDNEIDLVIGDPLDTLGTEGVGSPDDTREFVRLLVPLGLTGRRAFLFLHHFRKEISISEINQVSGAWGGRLDTLLVLKETDQPDELRLSLPKLRWASDLDPLILGKLRDIAGFELLRRETHEPDPSEDAVDQMLHKIVGVLRKKASPTERQVLALHLETQVANRTFNSALKRGWDRGFLAKDRTGKKTTYSLTEEAYL